jgi:succinate-semialdehyde dehydrogenase/glutarate-semialdehyde dehydrogenase
MGFESINPADGSTLEVVPEWDDARLESALASAARAAKAWSEISIERRCERLRAVARVLRSRHDELARLITLEMGKLLTEARAEVEKCALACDYFADHAAGFLADEVRPSDARVSYVAYQPLGTVLAVMPWNFPLWQVFRFGIPALAAGNTIVLKHASNVPQCALAIEDVFHSADLPRGVFVTLMIAAARVGRVIGDDRVRGVTLTGSADAGRKVAAAAGAALKKCVLELGGSDAFVVLRDADLDAAVKAAMRSRFQNAGQSCIAAKRFIVVESIADRFVERFRQEIASMRPGNPMNEGTTLAPLARADLRDTVQRQVAESLARGAVAVIGCGPITGHGFYYQGSLLDYVSPGMPAFDEEVFGPVAAIVRVRDEQKALELANRSKYGLGASVWTTDAARGEQFARRLECGVAFVNGVVKSDPRLPFGGVKNSGYGRELSVHGCREFTNVKTIWIH